MSLETATYINQLDAANPLRSDPIASGDDHIRLIKSTIKATFPNITGPVTAAQATLSNALNKTGDTMTGPLVLSGNPTVGLNPATKQYVDAADSSLSTSVGLKADKSVAISAGAGLTGGGDLSANRSLAIADGGVTAAKLASGAAASNLGSYVTSVNGSSGAVTVPVPIGVGQTWQNVTASRSSGTSYTNNTGKPILVNAFSSRTDSGFQLTAVCDGITVGYQGGGGGGDARRAGFVSFIVPNGSSYTVTYSGGADGSTLQWAELR